MTSAAVGKTLRKRRDEILEDWFHRVSQRPRAREFPRETIMNNVPQLLDQLIEALSQPQALQAVIAIPREYAERHGEGRLELGYGLEELGEEYNSLRGALLDALDREHVSLSNHSASALHSAVDQAHRAGVERYISLREGRLLQRQSDFLARLTHDFRTPLASILTGVELLRRQLPPLAAAPRTLTRIEKAARRLLFLVEGQLATEQALSGHLQVKVDETDLGSLVEDVVEMVRPRADAKGLHLQIQVPAGSMLWTDRLLLGQVLQNLVDNAIKYTDAGQIVLSAQSRGTDILLVIQDTGRGIKPEVLPVIFEMYRRAEHTIPGQGIGLSAVKAMVSALAGSIEVQSEEGKGSRFTLSLPRRLSVTPPA